MFMYWDWDEMTAIRMLWCTFAVSGSGYCSRDENLMICLGNRQEVEGKPRCGCFSMVAGGSSKSHSLLVEYFMLQTR